MFTNFWIIVLIFIQAVTARYTDCGITPNVPNSNIQIIDDDNNVIVIYKCNTGYELEGPSEITCDLDTDEWLEMPPKCIKTDQEIQENKKPQKKPQNGKKLSDEFLEKLDVSCIEAKVKAPSIKNGQILKYDRKNVGNGKKFLVAIYECNDHFALENQENSMLYCSKGKWISSLVNTLPNCISNGEESEEEEYDEYDEKEDNEYNDLNNEVNHKANGQVQKVNEKISNVNENVSEIENKNENRRVLIQEEEIVKQENEENKKGLIIENQEENNQILGYANENINLGNNRIIVDVPTEKIIIETCEFENGKCDHNCEMFNNEIQCSCLIGFRLNLSDKKTCIDIDECTDSDNISNCPYGCENLEGSFRCIEPPPTTTTTTSTTSTTTTTTESALDNEVIEPKNINININLAVELESCEQGFRRNSENICIDIDECIESITGCQYCENTDGSYECTCPSGYDLDDNGKLCQDINECEMYKEYDSQENLQSNFSPCSHECKNEIGTFKCICPENYHLSVDQRTCVRLYCEDLKIDDNLSNLKCSHTCEDSAKGYSCQCPENYSLDADLKTCVIKNLPEIVYEKPTILSIDILDVDQCLEANKEHKCHPGICISKVDTFICECPTGYSSIIGQNCEDIDECTLGTHRCSYYCSNTEGSYTCFCPENYELSLDNRTCTLIDHCSNNNGKCSHFCSSTATGTTCKCPRDMYLLDDGYTCEKIDVCSINNGGCSHICISTPDDFQCKCPVNMRLIDDGLNCEEINICSLNNGDCSQICNSTNSNLCSCLEGFKLLNDKKTCVDIDECLDGSASCNQICKNLPGSYQCLCEAGFVMLNHSGHCIDIDECLFNNGNCSNICINLPGSYQCSCPIGQMLIDDEKTCRFFDECFLNNGGCSHGCAYEGGKVSCFCPKGHRLSDINNKICLDINECLENAKCSHFCENTAGSYICKCPNGYALGANSFDCIDENECNQNNGNCSNICINILGSYECSCEIGYELDNDLHTCKDINECAQIHSCSHICTNRIGSYECSCPDGFKLQENNQFICQDINECQINNGNCQAKCFNTLGSFYCDSIDYCLDAKCSHDCKNYGNSFICECPKGYVLANDNFTCVDFNECYQNNGGCLFSCENTPGSFNCKCNNGYQMDSNGDCIDINECTNRNGGCLNNAICINLPGSMECSCPEGFILSTNKTSCYELKDFCEPLTSPEHGYVHCTKLRHKTQMYYKTKCSVWCENGYKLTGPTVRYCSETGFWDDFENRCLPNSCEKLEKPKHGVMLPTECVTMAATVGQRCLLTCAPGYIPIGKRAAICNADQRWSTNSTLDCIPVPTKKPNIIQPFIKCPQDTVLLLPPGQKAVFIRLEQPKTNVDYFKYVDAHPNWAKDLDAQLGPGEHVITFRARSPNSYLNAICKSVITVKEHEGIKITYCPPSYEIQLGTGESSRSLSWKEPAFQSQTQIKHITKSQNSGDSFGPGIHNVAYVATDKDGYSVKCEFQLIVKAGAMPSVSSKLVMNNQLNNQLDGYKGSGLPNHESFLICPGKPANKIDNQHPIIVPVGCHIKNIRFSTMRHHKRRHEHSRYINNLRHYSSWNDPRLEIKARSLYRGMNSYK